MSIRQGIAYCVFTVLNLLWFPFLGFGIKLYFSHCLEVSKRHEVSFTALSVLVQRWNSHRLGIRLDKAAAKLGKSLIPNATRLLDIAFFPGYIYFLLSGGKHIQPCIAPSGKEKHSQVVINRSVYIDAILARAAVTVEQFVILGAGFDTRNYNLSLLSRLTCFELDKPSTQRFKKDALKKAGISIHNVHYVEADFQNRKWPEQLLKAGYDPTKRTVFLWEGVTLYISEDDVRATLCAMKKISASGSVLVADIYRPPQKQYQIINDALKESGETQRFGIAFGTRPKQMVQRFVESECLRLGEAHCMGCDTRAGTFAVVSEIFI